MRGCISHETKIVFLTFWPVEWIGVERVLRGVLGCSGEVGSNVAERVLS